MTEMERIGAAAKGAERTLASAGTAVKDRALEAIAQALTGRAEEILSANAADVAAAREAGMTPAMTDRLRLTAERIDGIASAVREVIALPDPVGRTDSGVTRPNGLIIYKTRVPLGVIGIIYEARPNVTVDAAALCLKSGNAVILRGGKEAIRSNTALAGIMRAAVEEAGLPADCIQLVEDTSRESAAAMMHLRGYLDVLIPRGGAGLIRSVVENSSVPVIQTGAGNCHVYVDASADVGMAVDIIVNAKTSRPSVCNAAETLLVHRDIAERFLPAAAAALTEKGVELRCCERALAIIGGAGVPAAEEDWATEYDDYILAVRVVDDIDEAMAHIARYGTMHSEAIVTESYAASQKFTRGVDAAAVYVNASTRFTDGGEFGLGAEIGISTQKLHARGPMGLAELTTIKYIVLGSGQIR